MPTSVPWTSVWSPRLPSARRARSVLLAHCHVSGLAVPSPEDRIATLRCMDVLNQLQIEVLDHLVFADGDYVSMAQSGLLRR